MLDLYVPGVPLPAGAYSKGRKKKEECTGDENCRMVWQSQRRQLLKEPILIEMTRQHVWDNDAAKTDSCGKKQIKEILFLYWLPFSACELEVWIWIKYQGNGSCVGEASVWFEPPNEQGIWKQGIFSSLFQLHFIIHFFLLLLIVVSPSVVFAAFFPFPSWQAGHVACGP